MTMRKGVFLAAAGPVAADSVHAVTFSASSQSFWGPGKSAASMDVFGFARELDFGIFGTLTSQVSAPSFPLGNNLNTSRSFSRNLGSTQSWSGSTNLDISAIEFPPDPFTLVEAGPTFRVTQGSSFRATGISGTLVYTNRATGTTRSTSFSAGAGPLVDLSEGGWWDFSVRDLLLSNSFATGFDAAIRGYVDVYGLPRYELTTGTSTCSTSRRSG